MNIESLAHGSLLPPALVEKVPQREKLILSFLLEYLKEQRLPAQLLVNGGYVRDLLLGKTPDDLDLSLCLRDCAPEVNIGSVMDGMEGFARSRPDLEVSSVQITTILSDTSKDKNIDTAKAHLGVGSVRRRAPPRAAAARRLAPTRGGARRRACPHADRAPAGVCRSPRCVSRATSCPPSAAPPVERPRPRAVPPRPRRGASPSRPPQPGPPSGSGRLHALGSGAPLSQRPSLSLAARRRGDLRRG